jgi:hypothetical protein
MKQRMINRACTVIVAMLVIIACGENVSGQTWVEVPMPEGVAACRDLASSRPGHLLLLANGKTMWSIDEGLHWQQGGTSDPSPQVSFIGPGTPSDIIAFSPSTAIISESYYIDYEDQSKSSNGGIMLTRDSGATWSLASDHTIVGLVGQTQHAPNGKTIIPFSGVVWRPTASQSAGGYFETSNGQDFSVVFYSAILGNERVGLLDVDNKIVVAKGDSHFVSTDGGKSFVAGPNTILNSNVLLRIKTFTRLGSGAYLSSDENAVYRAQSVESDWLRVGEGGDASFVEGYSEVFRFSVKDSILYVSTDDGATWTSRSFEGWIGSVIPISETLIYVLAGNKIYKRELPSGVDLQSNHAALTISPNPGVNELRIGLAGSSLAGEISIVDITGREVLRTTAGEQVDVSALPSGVYQLVLSSGGKRQSQRFVIAR